MPWWILVFVDTADESAVAEKDEVHNLHSCAKRRATIELAVKQVQVTESHDNDGHAMVNQPYVSLYVTILRVCTTYPPECRCSAHDANVE